MITAFGESVPGGVTRTFTASGHFAYLEEPAAYCAAVTDFVLTHAA